MADFTLCSCLTRLALIPLAKPLRVAAVVIHLMPLSVKSDQAGTASALRRWIARSKRLKFVGLWSPLPGFNLYVSSCRRAPWGCVPLTQPCLRHWRPFDRLDLIRNP